MFIWCLQVLHWFESVICRARPCSYFARRLPCMGGSGALHRLLPKNKVVAKWKCRLFNCRNSKLKQGGWWKCWEQKGRLFNHNKVCRQVCNFKSCQVKTKVKRGIWYGLWPYGMGMEWSLPKYCPEAEPEPEPEEWLVLVVGENVAYSIVGFLSL